MHSRTGHLEHRFPRGPLDWEQREQPSETSSAVSPGSAAEAVRQKTTGSLGLSSWQWSSIRCLTETCSTFHKDLTAWMPGCGET